MKLTLTTLIALSIGFFLGWTVTRAPSAPSRVASEAPVAPVEPVERESVLEPAAADSGRSTAAEPAGADAERIAEGLISDALRHYALDELAAGWNELRPEPMPAPLVASGFDEFETTVRVLPRQIGRRLAERRGREEKLESDDPFSALEAIASGDVPAPVERVLDAERFRKYFLCEGGQRVDGPTWLGNVEARAEGLLPGSTIAFPKGVYDVQPLQSLLDRSVRCITFTGAGKDRTVLRLSGFLPRERLDRFTLADCTVLTECDALDLRHAGVFRAERVRFLGFDCGAGGCGLFDVAGGAVLELEDCDVVGGYGRNPGDACLFDARGAPILARFDRCTLDTLRIQSGWWPSGSVVAFVGCSIVNLLQKAPPSEEDETLLRSTTVELRAADAGPIPRRSLDELFPGWGLAPR